MKKTLALIALCLMMTAPVFAETAATTGTTPAERSVKTLSRTDLSGAVEVTSVEQPQTVVADAKKPAALLIEAIEKPVESADRFTLLQDALKQNPNYHDAIYRLADSYDQVGQYDKAVQHYDRALKLEPAHSTYLRQRSSLYARLGRYSEGIERFRGMFAENRDNTLAMREVANLQHDLEQYEEALKSANIWMKWDRQNVEAYTLTGKLLRKLERYDEAIGTLNDGIALDPANVAITKELQLCYMAKKDYEGGINAFEALVERHPANSRNLLYLSELYSLADDQANAERTAQAFADLQPEDNLAEAFNVLASALERGEKFEDALKNLFHAEKTDQDSEFIQDRIKDVLFKIERYEDGIDYFTRIAAESPNHYTLRILGELNACDENWSAAREWFTSFLKQKPYNALAYAQLGTALSKTGDDRAALEAFQNAAWYNLEIRDNFYRANRVYLKLNMIDEGISYFEGMIEKMPEKAELHAYVADFYEAKGMKAEAIAALKKVQELRPVSSQEEGVAERIARLSMVEKAVR